MPNFNHAQSFDGFVSLAQVCSPPAVLHAGAEYFDFEAASPMSPGFPGTVEFSQCQMACGSNQQSFPFPQEARHSAIIPAMTRYSSSSPSDSPSPTETVQEHQNSKRRQQNRQAQRAYRDRKVRHLLDLEQGIRDIEQTMLQLQRDNTELIRQLCDVKARNQHLRSSKRSSSSSDAVAWQNDRPTPSRTASRDSVPISRVSNVADKDSESLYEPFAAMWNLIRMDPAVVSGKVSARTLLENLSRLAETDLPDLEASLPSPFDSNEENRPASPIYQGNKGEALRR